MTESQSELFSLLVVLFVLVLWFGVRSRNIWQSISTPGNIQLNLNPFSQPKAATS